jgi:4a-hydroxytetrahydrobiopterin dehydratase
MEVSMTTAFAAPSAEVAKLATQHCRAGTSKLADDTLRAKLAVLDGWTNAEGRLEKTYRFADFHETIGFVNALAWIANREDHHPDLAVSYNRCDVAWSTHDAGGVTDNDVVCAAKTDALLG